MLRRQMGVVVEEEVEQKRRKSHPGEEEGVVGHLLLLDQEEAVEVVEQPLMSRLVELAVVAAEVGLLQPPHPVEPEEEVVWMPPHPLPV